MKRFFVIFLMVVLALGPVAYVMAEAVEATPVPVVVVAEQPTYFNLTAIILGFIGLLGVVITKKLWPWIEANTTVGQRQLLQLIISTLVFAAEQLYGSGRGTEKMEYVKNELRKRGFDIDIAEIEAAVQKLTLLQDALPLPVEPVEPDEREPAAPLRNAINGR